MMVLLTDFCWSNIDQEGSRTFNFQRLPVESLPFQDLLLTHRQMIRGQLKVSSHSLLMLKVNRVQFDLMISIKYCIKHEKQIVWVGLDLNWPKKNCGADPDKKWCVYVRVVAFCSNLKVIFTCQIIQMKLVLCCQEIMSF